VRHDSSRLVNMLRCPLYREMCRPRGVLGPFGVNRMAAGNVPETATASVPETATDVPRSPHVRASMSTLGADIAVWIGLGLFQTNSIFQPAYRTRRDFNKQHRSSDSMSARSVRMKPDDDQPGVGSPDVEPGRFANFMSVQGHDAFKRFTPLKPGADSTVESVCGADRRQPLHPTLSSSAAAFESPQVSGGLQAAVADFTLGVIQGVQDAVTDEAPDEDDPIDFDSDDTSDEEDAAAPTPRTLAQKKELRAQHRQTYMGVRRDSPMGHLNPLVGTEQMIQQMHAIPGTPWT